MDGFDSVGFKHAAIVNQIVGKFRGLEIEFHWIGAGRCDVTIGPREYRIEAIEQDDSTFNFSAVECVNEFDSEETPFSIFIQGVMNGMKRNESGELVLHESIAVAIGG